MILVPTEEQQLLRRSAADFVASKSSLRRIRALRDSGDAAGFSRDLWREMAALGWAGITVPETYGGSGLGSSDLAVVMEELGRGLVPEPMIPTVLASAAITLGGTEQQKRELLPSVASGEAVLAVAWQEPAGRFSPYRIATHAETAVGGWTVSGEKTHVLAGNAADRLLVSAVTVDGQPRPGLTLFLVDPRAKGVTITRQSLIDGRGAALVRLDRVLVPADAAVGEVDRGGILLEAAIDRATAALSAEMLGSMLAAFEMTLEYLKTRKQFGVLIGTFQALKHRAAIVFTETELARSTVMAANAAIDEQRPDARALVSLAKARASDAFLLAANEAIQMHGGIGMTDEHDIGFFLKRARAAAATFGDAAWHRRRYAALNGF